LISLFSITLHIFTSSLFRWFPFHHLVYASISCYFQFWLFVLLLIFSASFVLLSISRLILIFKLSTNFLFILMRWFKFHECRHVLVVFNWYWTRTTIILKGELRKGIIMLKKCLNICIVCMIMLKKCLNICSFLVSTTSLIWFGIQFWGSSPLPIAVAGDRIVILHTKFNANHHWTH
jgi:hypothetical protein